MNKNKKLTFRVDEDILEFVRKEVKNSNKTMSDWIREQIKTKKGK
jgi:hypothetical protein